MIMFEDVVTTLVTQTGTVSVTLWHPIYFKTCHDGCHIDRVYFLQTRDHWTEIFLWGDNVFDSRTHGVMWMSGTRGGECRSEAHLCGASQGSHQQPVCPPDNEVLCCSARVELTPFAPKLKARQIFVSPPVQWTLCTLQKWITLLHMCFDGTNFRG